jgi:hypothetical protein
MIALLKERKKNDRKDRAVKIFEWQIETFTDRKFGNGQPRISHVKILEIIEFWNYSIGNELQRIRKSWPSYKPEIRAQNQRLKRPGPISRPMTRTVPKFSKWGETRLQPTVSYVWSWTCQDSQDTTSSTFRTFTIDHRYANSIWVAKFIHKSYFTLYFIHCSFISVTILS